MAAKKSPSRWKPRLILRDVLCLKESRGMPHLSDRSERRACGSVEGDKRGRDRMPAHEKIHFTKPGTKLQVESRSDGWLGIFNPTSQMRGWILEQYLSFAGPS